MARTTTLTDDMDGTPDAVERRFNIGGTDYAIDLCDVNYAKFLDAVAPYRAFARVATNSRTNHSRRLTPEDCVAIREWAADNNKYLAARGRFPKALVEEYFSEQDARILVNL